MPAAARADRALTDIDRFIVRRLQREGLAMSPAADKETLINRVTLTLTGLPPTLAEVDAFVADSSPTAYEKVVDRLLASPAYGEHMASYWADVSRYSESDGFLDDYHDRLLWPYRDWVIAAFNQNMPFNQFGTWQIAGDLLPGRTPQQKKEQTLATAFLRVGKRTTENGAIDEEYRVEYAVDRTNTIGTAFLGLTVGCARCHDHKYDPISQKDFYSLSGLLQQHRRAGLLRTRPHRHHRGADAAVDRRRGGRRRSRRPKRESPSRRRPTPRAVAAATRDAAPRAASLAGNPAEAAAAVRHVAAEGARRALSVRADRAGPRRPAAPVEAGQPAARPAAAGTGNGLVRRLRRPATWPDPNSNATGGPASAHRPAARPPAPQGDPRTTVPERGNLTGEELQQVVRRVRTLPADLVRDSLRFSPSSTPGAGPALTEAPILKEGVKGKAFFFDDNNRGILGDGVGDYERTQPFSIDLWVRPNQIYEDATVFNHREDNNTGNAGYQLQLDKNRLQFDLQHSRAGNMIRVVSRAALPLQQWSRVTVTYDGSSTAAGVALYLNGARAGRRHRQRQPDAHDPPERRRAVRRRIPRDHVRPPLPLHADEGRGDRRVPRLQPGADTGRGGVPRRRGGTAGDPGGRCPALEAVLVANDPRVVAAAEALSAARSDHNQLVSVVPQVPVMGDTLKPRPTYLLIRGVYTDHGDEVQPQGLERVFPWDPSLPRNRVGLARWLFDPKHPLTSRVFVNRMWQRVFGRGLVETSEDFGAQGAIPSHPELLDWLAVSFVESGWNVKGLMKQLVMSAAFRQSSVDRATSLEEGPAQRAAGALQPRADAGRDGPRPGPGGQRPAGPADRRQERLSVPARQHLGRAGALCLPRGR